MTPEEGRKLLKLMREHFCLQAEVYALAAILETAVTLDEAPYGWLDALKQARQQDAYRSIAEQFEPQFVQIERALGAKEAEGKLADLLGSLPPTQFLN